MIKRIFSLIFAFVLGAMCMHSVDAEEQTTVHYVSNEHDLILMHDFPDHSFYLTEDIYLSKDWAVCGVTEEEAFCGLLDGQGHTITHVNVDSNSGIVAFIGYLKGTVKSVNFIRAEIKAEDAAVVGGIAAYNLGTITDCSISGKIIRGTISVDKCGIAAVNKGVISNCRDNTVAENNVSSTSPSSSAITVSNPSANVSSHVSDNTTSTNSIITQIEYNNSSKPLPSSSVTASANDDRENVVEYFDRTQYDDGKKVNKNVTIAVICMVAVGMFVICGMSIYREIKITKLEKQNKKK